MLGEGKRGGCHVEPHELHEVEGERALGRLGDAGVEEARPGLLAAFGDIAHQRHDGLAYLGEERVVGGGVHTALVLVEPDVVGVALAIEVAGLALERLDHAIDIGLEGVPVVGALCLVPYGVGLASEAAPALDLLLGEGEGLALIAFEDAELVGQLRVIELALGIGLVELADELLSALAGKQLVVLAGERRYGLAACGGTVFRRDGGAVELGDLQQVGAGPEVALKGAELLGALRGLADVAFFVAVAAAVAVVLTAVFVLAATFVGALGLLLMLTAAAAVFLVVAAT